LQFLASSAVVGGRYVAVMEIPRIRPDEVMQRMGAGERVVFVDARNREAWAGSDVQLPGAIRVPADRVDENAARIPRGALIVAY
jgi:hypothetical protein